MLRFDLCGFCWVGRTLGGGEIRGSHGRVAWNVYFVNMDYVLVLSNDDVRFERACVGWARLGRLVVGLNAEILRCPSGGSG